MARILKDRTAIVTGAGRGIGRAIATRLAAAGCSIAALSRTGTELNSLAQEVETQGVGCYANLCDVGDHKQVHQFVLRAREALGKIDILVANAGIFHPAPILSHNIDAFDRQMATNARGTFLFVRELIGDMFEHGQGDIVGICSIASFTPFAGASAYCASKFAQLGFLRALSAEVRKQGVRVTAICPGATATSSWNFDDPNAPDPDDMVQPDQVAEAVLHVLTVRRGMVIDEIHITPQKGIL